VVPQPAPEERIVSAVAELAPALIWKSDADKRFTYVNKARTAFTGRPPEAVLEDGWRETVSAAAGCDSLSVPVAGQAGSRGVIESTESHVSS
jgi:PAS domain-containing protein